MIRSSVLLVVLVLTAGVASAGASAGNTAADKAIRSALAGWVEAANRGDYKATMSVWAPDLIGWAPEGPDDSYERELRYTSMPPQPVSTTYALTIDEIIVDGSLTVVRDTWTQTTKPQTGPDKVSTFRSFEVWRRQEDGSWKISRWLDGPMRPQATSH